MLNFKKIKERVREVPKFVWILLAIISIGIFLRTYHFHDWLLFESDQARDATLVDQVIAGEKPWPLLGQTMRGSSELPETLFRVGPIYYHFQILSTLIFGSGADTKAYPDLFFAILSIPLLFYFLKRYFSTNIALCLTGLYATSFFVVKYSRFAWNPNPIPFFVILFLFSLHEFILKREATSWPWIGLLGISLGIGVQLHVTVLLAFFGTIFFVSLYLLKKNKGTWKKILAVLILAFFINTPQILSEIKTGFSNSRALLNSSVNESQAYKRSKLFILAESISCNIEANAYILTSLGQETCDFGYVKMFEKNKSGKAFRKNAVWPEIFAIFCFSLFGYVLFGYRFRKESNDGKKYFLGVCLLFALVYFAVMFPVIGSGFDEFRYFSPLFFIPLLLFGLLLDFLVRKRQSIYFVAALFLVLFLIGSNAISMYNIVIRLIKHEGNNGHSVFLGEAEHIMTYIRNASTGESDTVYLRGDKLYRENIFYPGAFIAKQSGWKLIDASDSLSVPKGAPLFFITGNHENYFEAEISELAVKNTENFGLLRLYQLDN